MRRVRPPRLSSIHAALRPAAMLLAFACATAWSTAQATTWYVRVDGGDAVQCNGRSNLPYPGIGIGRACAWKHPFFALPPTGLRRMLGGDTLVIGSGSYKIGPGAPGAGACLPGNCSLSTVPNGLVGAPTRILGTAASPPRLWGTAGTSRIFSLDHSSRIELGYLTLTDQDDCVYHHSNLAAKCASVGAGAWGKYGIFARASSEVWLHDLDIHGMAHSGLWAGGLSNWTLERVRLRNNGRAGWDTNIGAGSNNTGTITLRGVEIAWNGCGERWQTGATWACWGQQGGGYGDGLGIAASGGRWLVEDSFVHHNTQDGVDLRHLDGADATQVTIRRLMAVGNAGNQVKIKGNAVVENSVLVGTCGYFSGRDYMQPADHCRADGTTLQLVFTPNDNVVVRHNTITGQGWSLVGTSGGDVSSRLFVQNNVLVGFPWFLRPTDLSRVRAGVSAAIISYAGNLTWSVYANICPPNSLCNQNPRLANMTLAGFDARPLAGSPVVDRVPPLADVRTDFLLNTRPQGAASDIGAYEYKLPVGCARAAPTILISGPMGAVPAGSAIRYTVTLTNNDNAGCAATAFALVAVVPLGWNSVLGSGALTIAPGARASTSLAVFSPAAAMDGEYEVGASSASGVGAAHVATVRTIFTVGESAPPGTPAAPKSFLLPPPLPLP